VSFSCKVGGRIRHYRLINGLKQKDVYEKAGIDKTTYIRYERNSTINHDIGICDKICEVIGIDPALVYDDYMTFAASDFGTSIKEFRKKHKLTHKQFGALIDMHPRISERWEMGNSVPSRSSYEKIIELFDRHGKLIK
jgi:transcriptional regulator with XRE-family HTH domain